MARPGNQSARVHGYTSKLHPLSLADFAEHIRQAHAARDAHHLHQIARGLEVHGHGREATRVRRLAQRIDGIRGKRARRAVRETAPPEPAPWWETSDLGV